MSKNIQSLAALALLCASGAVYADSISLNIDLPAQYTTSSAPSAAALLTVSDYASNEVQLTLTTNLTGSQTLTGLWLDAPGQSSLALSSAPAASPLAPTLTYASTQSIVPNGNQALTGAYNLALKFPNNATGLQGTTTETFYLTGSNLDADLFATAAAQKSGAPNPDYSAVMAVTNAAGANTGPAYFGAITPVPLPAALPLLIGGVGGLAGFLRRRRAA